jgi:hypothetical protein
MSKVMYRRHAILACLAILMPGCSSVRSDGDLAVAAQDFYKQSVETQLRAYRTHSVSDQLSLYFYGNQRRHPPAIYLARCFALNGAAAIPLLKAKLASGPSDLDVRDTAYLLENLDSMGRYDVSNDKDLMADLSVAVSRMRDASWQKVAQGELSRLGAHDPFPAQDAPECH